ncbi:LacI family DNA-binding transcriptional regulator [Pontivivens insulae]|uniref:HTH-type transcriptional regulator DegA n=1 Tax=Pontivivens insulae TaxID=1639689 RepID=A0A2R8A8B3_9RHOB|nr:LacI family DNA-binding transcriptional regulator [Pontivivens insulae]RED18360.1 LacI family transcriptional regulator [Pontivivens insulae]SPF28258.1 HTH-type transcriptional regulator DegA [Pontivivens insulae]
MTKRATLQDVADAAGVSYATADRFINRRGGVAEKSRRKVEAAIRALNYIRDDRAANLARNRNYRFVFVLPGGANAFYDALRTSLRDAVVALMPERVTIDIVEFTPFDADDLIARLSALDADVIDGLAVVANADQAVCDRLRALRRQGVAVVSLVAETARDARDAYIGLDNRRAGSLAARMLAFAHRHRAGRILPIVGAHDAPDHAERLGGFLQTMGVLNPDVHILPAVRSSDDAEEVERLVTAATAEGSTITGLYNVGAGNRGLLRALQNRSAHRPAVIVHELSETTEAALRADLIDAIIDQKPQEEIAKALGVLRALADQKTLPPIDLIPAIYMQENLPAASGQGTEMEGNTP